MRLQNKRLAVILFVALFAICSAAVTQGQDFSRESTGVSGFIFYDDFNDNRMDRDKWTPLCGDGISEEKNQQLVFQVQISLIGIQLMVGEITAHKVI